MYLKARLNGKWMEAIPISSGAGIVKPPDMKVDKKGTLHIAYIKDSGTNLGCYYKRIQRKESNEVEGVFLNR